MSPTDAKKALLKVLSEIQKRSGLDIPALNDDSVPPKALPKFDSTVWPVATTLVARELDVSIPNAVHIFGGFKGVPLLTIDQISKLICKHALPKGLQQVAA